MFGQQSSVFPKQIKLDDYSQNQEENILCILESSNLLLGTGARTSHTAIILAKALHYLTEEGVLNIHNKTILELGCGVGLLGIYLAAIGNKVIMSDLPAIKDLVQRNLGLNKSLIKGKAEFIIANWYLCFYTGNRQTQNQGNSTTSSEKPQCLTHLIEEIDYTICCQCGGLAQLQCQLKFMGKEGLFLAFMEKNTYNIDNQDNLTIRMMEEYLIQREIQYEKIDQYHPDYFDERVGIFHIWK